MRGLRSMILFVMFFSQTTLAFTVGSLGRMSGPVIHTTYFVTPLNGPTQVQAFIYAGRLTNGICQYNAIYHVGSETVKTGDFFDLDAFKLRDTIGLGFNCLSIYYHAKQRVIESLQLLYDGINYQGSYPPVANITII